ncbi:MAG: hypothetical protein R3C12_17260 [Planctomycetaceae bacterium]
MIVLYHGRYSRWERETDILRMMKIVIDSGYKGFIGIEYEGGKLDRFEAFAAPSECCRKFSPKLC